MKNQYLNQNIGISIQNDKLDLLCDCYPSQSLIDSINYCEDVRAGKIKTKSYASLKEILKEVGI